MSHTPSDHGFSPHGFPQGVAHPAHGFLAHATPVPFGVPASPAIDGRFEHGSLSVSPLRVQGQPGSQPGTGPERPQHAGPNGGPAQHHQQQRPASNGTRGDGDEPVLLVDLVKRSEQSVVELERLARVALDATAAATQASTDLQERLRLGVRMLQAFDVQIQRTEQTSTNAGMQAAAQFTNHINAVGQQCEMRLRAAMEMLDHRIAESVPFLDERLRQAHEQVGRLVEDRLAAAERRIDERYGPARDELRSYADDIAAEFAAKLDRLVDERTKAIETLVESRIEAAVRAMPVHNASQPSVQVLDDATRATLESLDGRVRHVAIETERRLAAIDEKLAYLAASESRVSKLIRESSDAADALLGTVGTATTLKDLVADEAAASRSMAAEAHGVAKELQRELLEVVEKATLVRSSITNDVRTIAELKDDVDGRVAELKGLRAEIETLQTRLAPWESMVRKEGTPMQQVVESISSGVRQSIGEEMRSFSQALRQLAGRAESAFANARFDEFSALAPAPTLSASHPMPTDALADATPISAVDPAQHASSSLPIETRRLTAEIMALDAGSLLKSPNPIL
jgi:hypothetical protein